MSHIIFPPGFILPSYHFAPPPIILPPGNRLVMYTICPCPISFSPLDSFCPHIILPPYYFAPWKLFNDLHCFIHRHASGDCGTSGLLGPAKCGCPIVIGLSVRLYVQLERNKRYLGVIHSPNLHQLFILTWSTDVTWWFVTLTYISHLEEMVESVLQYLWVLHSPNLHKLFILTWSTDTMWWFVSLTYISGLSDHG